MTAPDFPFRNTHDDTIEQEYETLHRRQGLTRVRLPLGGEGWLACRYEHVRQVLGDKRFSRAEAEQGSLPRFSDACLPTTTLMAMPEPRHAIVRRAIAPLFTARRVEEQRQSVRELAEYLIGTFVADGLPGDLVPTIQQFTLGCVGLLLGHDMRSSQQIDQLARGVLDAGISNKEVWRERGQNLEDAISNWLTSVQGSALHTLTSQGILTNEELIQFVRSMFLGGAAAPTSFLTGAVHTLIRLDTDHRLTAPVTPEQMPSLANELLRFVPTGAVGFTRRATDDVLVGDSLVATGEIVVPVVAAANRDPAAFESPNTLDTGRSNKTHLAFGHGAHYCPGAYLSQVEAEEFLTTLMRLAPGLREIAVEWAQGPLLRNIARLEVRL